MPTLASPRASGRKRCAALPGWILRSAGKLWDAARIGLRGTSGPAQESGESGCIARLTQPIEQRPPLDALAGCTPEPGSERIAVTAPEGFEKLSRDYLTRRKEAVPAFRNSLESGDYDRIRRMAHDIKGTGASYGFPPITNVGRVLEQAAVAGDLARLEHALRSMERYLDAVELKPRGSDGSEAGL